MSEEGRVVQGESLLSRFHSVDELPGALSAAQMRELDRITIEEMGVPGPVLMERAAFGVTEFLLRRYAGRHTLVVCGRGNNGGDGLASARQLHLAGHPVVCAVAAEQAEQLSPDARTNLEAARRLGVNILMGATAESVPGYLLGETEVVVDCLLGTGASGEMREPLAGLARMINTLGARGIPVVAVDIPSGVDAGTGTIASTTVAATHTITFHSAKTGLVVPPGREAAGEILVWEIGLPRHLEPECDVCVVATGQVRVPGRRSDDHKYRAGYVAVLAGSAEYPGAALLTAGAAVRAGAGYVRLLAVAAVVAALPSVSVEITSTSLGESPHLRDVERTMAAVSDPRISALAFGPGLGRELDTAEVVRHAVMASKPPAVLDADGILAFAGRAGDLAARPGLVLTPHVGELATLMGASVSEVGRAPLAAAREAAAVTNQVVLLKGSASVIAQPGGRTWAVVNGPPQLASAGTGDVLTGVICDMLAKGLAPVEAACTGAWVHAEAGRLAAKKHRAGAWAGAVLDMIPAAYAGRVYDRRPSWTK